MAATPRFKIFDKDGNYQASCHEVEAGAALLGALYASGTIRIGHSVKDIVYRDGVDGNAGESYDAVAIIVDERVQKMHAELQERIAEAKRRHEARA
jgi:hypothetical protein